MLLTSYQPVTIMKLPNGYSGGMTWHGIQKPYRTARAVSQSGYLATSMNDIRAAGQPYQTALLTSIFEQAGDTGLHRRADGRMDWAKAPEMQRCETGRDGFAEAYQHIPAEQIYAYSLAQFRHWTEKSSRRAFPRDGARAVPRPGMGRLYRDYARPEARWGGDLSEDGGLGRTGNDAARAAILWARCFSFVQRV